jgi:hypothetical protein
MPRIDISQLPDDSRVWIFGISPALDDAKSTRVLQAVDQFLDQWSAHNVPIVSARDLLHGSFLVVTVDKHSETSGCSIDRMFGLLQRLERELKVSILEANRIFCRDESGAVVALSTPEFGELGQRDTVVFDILSERLGQIRKEEWVGPAHKSWHHSLLKKSGLKQD